ncbi:MAG: beta-lactamase family protein [Gemmatimonadetes bacterium]|jgi:CubicO group peptidase (beta-lactamase class C family)|nr:beta-lactamase family protein [Gemmatimonadota bacterium]MBK9549288.1 beta-lactamase family protein [Gemmatimonadota bacterium]MBP9897670.1 beta-lactamase family protein [Gemmatimonadales bacterium]
MTRSIRLAVLVVLLAQPLTAQTLPKPAAVRRIADSLAAAFVTSGGAPSVAVAMVRGTDTLAFGAWGKADLENSVAATTRSVYRIGSVTKQFTAAAVMQLVEQGRIAVDDSIGAQLPTLPAAWRGVTIRQLLNHTSGIPSYTDLGQPWFRRFAEEMTPDTLVALTAAKPLDFAPGTKWKYNNTGYVVLGMLIEKLTGHAWAADMRERFAVPYGLDDTQACLTAPVIFRRVHGYEREKTAWINTVFLHMSQPYAAGSMCSTIGDLTKWNAALHGGKVVSAASYEMMTTPSGAAATGALPYGFGLGRAMMGERVVITHGGGIPGFITSNAWIPSLQLSITVLTNSGSAKPDDLMRMLARAAVGAPLVMTPPAPAPKKP